MENKRVAILIGCNDYDNLPALRCPVSDVSEMSKALKDAEIGGFQEIYSFTDHEPNYEILPQIEEIITGNLNLNDTLLIFFSGHGKLDQLGKLYLALKNTKNTSMDSTSIAIERIISYIDRSRCKTVLIILDCCYSGAIKGVFHKSGVDDAFTSAIQGRGIQIITSSTGMEQSHEKEGDTNSIFTKFFIEGLTTGHADLDNNGIITVDEAYTYTYNLVKGTGLQNPMKFNIDTRGDIILAKNRLYTPVEVPDPFLVPQDQHRKFFAIKNMLELLGSKDPPKFFVVLMKYYIEDEEYRASGLTVTSSHTPNIRQTQQGFECDAFFPPNMLTAHSMAGKEVVNNIIKVRMKVKMEDIFALVGSTESGQQLNLLV
jgi:hypothetical protein